MDWKELCLRKAGLSRAPGAGKKVVILGVTKRGVVMETGVGGQL